MDVDKQIVTLPERNFEIEVKEQPGERPIVEVREKKEILNPEIKESLDEIKKISPE